MHLPKVNGKYCRNSTLFLQHQNTIKWKNFRFVLVLRSARINTMSDSTHANHISTIDPLIYLIVRCRERSHISQILRCIHESPNVIRRPIPLNCHWLKRYLMPAFHITLYKDPIRLACHIIEQVECTCTSTKDIAVLYDMLEQLLFFYVALFRYTRQRQLHFLTRAQLAYYARQLALSRPDSYLSVLIEKHMQRLASYYQPCVHSVAAVVA